MGCQLLLGLEPSAVRAPIARDNRRVRRHTLWPATVGRFPEGIPDDKFVRMLFEQSERAVTPSAAYEVVLPSSLAALIRARRGYDLSNQRLRAEFPELDMSARVERRAGMMRWFLNPANVPDGLMLFTVRLATRLSSRWQRRPTESVCGVSAGRAGQ